MKRIIALLFIFFFTAFVYFGISSRWTFHAKWYLDYFNPLAKSLMQGRVDIDPPGSTYDLVSRGGKWYLLWGVLPALFLVPLQLIKGGFIPTIYLSVLFSGLNVCIAYLLLLRIRREFFPAMRSWEIIAWTILFAFGTTHLYVGTLGSVWHVDQIVSSFFGNAAVYVVFKKNRRDADYLLSAWLLLCTLAGRATIVLLCSIPAGLFLWQYVVEQKKNLLWLMRKGILLFGAPALIGVSWFFLYNFFRFGSIMEYGYLFLAESSFLGSIREAYGIISLHHLPRNLWYLLFEIPALSLENGIRLGFNLKGNSIFFLTPPLLALFLATPVALWGKRWMVNPYVLVLWVGTIVTMVPSLLWYSTGWMQFGYRFTLDITLILLLLAVFGVRGKINILLLLGIAWAVWMHWMGITALM